MNQKIIKIFKEISKLGDCCKIANNLTRKLSESGFEGNVRRVFHKSNVFGNNPFVFLEHICGELFEQHYVVEVDGCVLDYKLNSPIPSTDYLKRSYFNHRDLKIA